MFSDDKKGKGIDPCNQQNRISQCTKIVGDIISQGGFRIDGEVEGNTNTPNKVVIGKTGVVKGSLICKDADIEGFIEGTIQVSSLLSIKSSARIEGEVTVEKLAVEPGATFNASCDMKGNLKSIAKDGKKQGEKSA